MEINRNKEDRAAGTARPWTPPARPAAIPQGDMPGDRIVIGEEHVRKALEIGRRLHMDICTVHRHNRRVMEALLAHVFGIYGVFQDRAGRGENGA